MQDSDKTWSKVVSLFPVLLIAVSFKWVSFKDFLKLLYYFDKASEIISPYFTA